MKTITVDLPDNVMDQFRSEQELKLFVAQRIAEQLVARMKFTLEVKVK